MQRAPIKDNRLQFAITRTKDTRRQRPRQARIVLQVDTGQISPATFRQEAFDIVALGPPMVKACQLTEFRGDGTDNGIVFQIHGLQFRQQAQFGGERATQVVEFWGDDRSSRSIALWERHLWNVVDK